MFNWNQIRLKWSLLSIYFISMRHCCLRALSMFSISLENIYQIRSINHQIIEEMKITNKLHYTPHLNRTFGSHDFFFGVITLLHLQEMRSFCQEHINYVSIVIDLWSLPGMGLLVDFITHHNTAWWITFLGTFFTQKTPRERVRHQQANLFAFELSELENFIAK